MKKLLLFSLLLAACSSPVPKVIHDTLFVVQRPPAPPKTTQPKHVWQKTKPVVDTNVKPDDFEGNFGYHNDEVTQIFSLSIQQKGTELKGTFDCNIANNDVGAQTPSYGVFGTINGKTAHLTLYNSRGIESGDVYLKFIYGRGLTWHAKNSYPWIPVKMDMVLESKVFDSDYFDSNK